MKYIRREDTEINAENFVGTLSVNVNNPKLSDAEFRVMVRDTVGFVYGAMIEVDENGRPKPDSVESLAGAVTMGLLKADLGKRS